MSSSAVRTAFRQALTDGFPSVPYVDSIAYETDQESLPKTWVTLEFVPTIETRETIDVPSWWNETGFCHVVIANEAGAGDATAVTLGDQVAAYFRNWIDPLDANFIVLDTSEPTQPDQESEGRWFFIVVNVQYSRRFLQ